METLEFAIYLVCAESDVSQEHFRKMFTSKGVEKQFLKYLGDDKRLVDIDVLMSFILETTNYKEVDEERLEKIQQAFITNFGRDCTTVGYEEFKKIIPCKDDFFARRLFQMFDCDQSNSISISEFCETVNAFYSEGEDSKLEFLFYIYDTNQDGRLHKENFHQVMQACMKESGMKLDQEQLSSLAEVLFEDGLKEGKDSMSLQDFKDQLHRQEGLINNLNTIIDKLIIPEKVTKSKSLGDKILAAERMRYLSWEYWTNNTALILTILSLGLMILIIAIQRIVHFRHMTMASGFPDLFTLVARASGKNLVALSVIVILLVLRNSITFLRAWGLGRYLPLDNNIYLHKVVGVLIFLLGMVHSLCHLLNFAINIQPDPLHYLLINYRYTRGAVPAYNQPPGCVRIIELDHERNNQTEPACSRPDWVDPAIAYDGAWECEVCEAGQAWTYVQWLLTIRPGLFGLVAGLANPTGLGLMLTMIIIFVCSLPFVRRRGHFEIFYFSHYLYLVYYVLMILHSPQFWVWFCPVGIIWLAEMIFRLIHSYMGRGRTYVEEGIILPSKVTNLIIKRPVNFTFNPGDWVFVRIPRYFYKVI